MTTSEKKVSRSGVPIVEPPIDWVAKWKLEAEMMDRCDFSRYPDKTIVTICQHPTQDFVFIGNVIRSGGPPQQFIYWHTCDPTDFSPRHGI